MSPHAITHDVPLALPRRPRAKVAVHLPPNLDAHDHAEQAALSKWLVTLTAALALIGLSYAWLSAQVRRYEYDRMALHEIVQRLKLEQHDLDAKLELLQRHDWIERVARDELGMTRPRPGQVQELP